VAGGEGALDVVADGDEPVQSPEQGWVQVRAIGGGGRRR
jgi:hypothetical protein